MKHASGSRFATLAALVLLSACGSAPPSSSGPPQAPPSTSSKAPAKINLSGFPPEFRQGYSDGCASADMKNPGRQVRNEARFKGDMQYASGWRDGYDMCKR